MAVKDAIKKLLNYGINSLPVIHENGRLQGVVKKEDILSMYVNQVSLEEPVGHYLNHDYLKFNENEPIETILKNHECNTIIVENDTGIFQGLLTSSIILNAFIGSISNTANSDSCSQEACVFSKDNDQKINLEKIYTELTQLKDLERELNEIIEFSADSIYVTDGKGNALRVNEAFEKITGIKKEQVLGKNGMDLEKEKIFEPSVTPIVLKEKREVTIIQKINNSRQAIVTGVPIFHENGEIFRIVLNAKSIGDSEILTKYFLRKQSYSTNKKSPLIKEEEALVFNSYRFRELIKMVHNIAPVDSTILMTGESGVGKSYLAKYIHNASLRSSKRFIEINCGAIPESLLESELFGYEGGAFTGANNKGKPGLIEMAEGGSLFLDEIGAMPLNLQVKLLQVIQNRQITRVGGTEPINVDIRIIAASNEDIKTLVKHSKFREDLYYRLNVIPIHIPPIRKRKDDIIPLANHFLKIYTHKYNKKISFSADAFEEMKTYSWPGNIREIENFIERVVVTSNGEEVQRKDIEDNFTEKDNLNHQPIIVNKIMPLKEAQSEVERILTIMAYTNCPNSYKMASMLGISQSGAHRKIQQHIYKKSGNDGI